MTMTSQKPKQPHLPETPQQLLTKPGSTRAPRHKARGKGMSATLRTKVSEEDKAQITLLAQEKGVTASAFVRQILIEARVIPPYWTSDLLTDLYERAEVELD